MKKSSQEFKQMQLERIVKTKPWLKSTGAKTAKGKERSKMNALKTSLALHSLIREYKQLIEQQQEVCNTIKHVKQR